MTLHKQEIGIHVERPERIESIHKFNLLRGLFTKFKYIPPQKCPKDYLIALHSEEYLTKHAQVRDKVLKYKSTHKKCKQMKKEFDQKKVLREKISKKELPKDELEALQEMFQDLKIEQPKFGDIIKANFDEEEKLLLRAFPYDIYRNFGSDNFENEFTVDSALLSAGAVKTAVESMFVAKSATTPLLDRVFCNSRPPGHHSLGHQTCQASGFCFFNNVALAARYAVDELKLKKVAILDWDIHHGDGTQKAFYNDPNVMYMSLHRFENGVFYPGKSGSLNHAGEGAGKGYNVNIEWNTKEGIYKKSVLGDHEYIFMFEEVISPILKEFQPELIIVSSGFDSADYDPIGMISNSPDTYAFMTHQLQKICKKVLVVLEGGYNLFALSVSSEAVMRVLSGDDKYYSEGEKYFQDLKEKYKEMPKHNVGGRTLLC